MPRGPIIATIEIRVIPFDGGYAFDVERAGVPLEDHPFAGDLNGRLFGHTNITAGLALIGLKLDEIEQAGP